jgi:hypothetical protein
MVFGEEYLKRHLQRDEGEQRWDARLDASRSMLDSGHELLDVRSADSTVVQDGFEKPAPPVIGDESESVNNTLLPDEVGWIKMTAVPVKRSSSLVCCIFRN